MNNKEYIWNYLKQKELPEYAIAGIMGNMQVESGFQPNNVENRCYLSDNDYTQQVDNGSYTNFANDSYGYGLVQWTYPTLKQDLLIRCRNAQKSISDMQCQLDQLLAHLQSENILNSLKNASSIEQATKIFMIKFEKPKDQSQNAKNIRINYAKNIYNELNQKGGNSKMNYSPIVCMQTKSTCYQQTNRMKILGVLWHSTGCNNPWIKRYVQPSENDSKYNQLIAQIGKNTGGNDWNHIPMQAGLNAWIGKIADGSVRAVQTMPWDYKPWGCGSGSRGSCNNGWIQFEICEDSLADQNYFNQIYQEACKLTAYLCKTYNLNPKGTVEFSGIQVPVILCHQDSAQLGLGSNHADVYHWFKKYSKDMNTVRNDVAELMGQVSADKIIDTLPNSAPVYSGNITFGEESTRVRELQQNLIKLGYSCGEYGADGSFGADTYKALTRFQEDYKLDIDGIAGPATQEAIANAIKALSTTPTSGIYRIRKSWADASSQAGAFSKLENAKALCNKLGSIYKVFDSNGVVVYSINQTGEQTQPVAEPKETVIQPARTYSNVMIGSASKDENGQYRGGLAGDQTGKEVLIMNWYYQNWNIVLRPVDSALAEKIASACEAACDNQNIGYDQLQRNTLFLEAKKVNLDISKIINTCECDCSSLVGTCCICAGLPEAYYYVNNNLPTTSTIRAACLNTGKFAVLTDNKYLTQKDYLKRGDILVNETQHAVIVLADGAKAEKVAIVEPQKIETITKNFEPYVVRINTNILNVRADPDKNSAVKGAVTKRQAFTIVDEKGGWGKLKSGLGWIDLSYTEKV